MVRQPALTEKEGEELAVEIDQVLAISRCSLNTLAKLAGVDQPMLWRAHNRLLKKKTAKLDRLQLYVRITLNRSDDRLFGLEEAIRGLLSSGGSIELLRAVIEALKSAAPNAPRKAQDR